MSITHQHTGESGTGFGLTRRGRLVLIGVPVLGMVALAVAIAALLIGSSINAAQASSEAPAGVAAEEVTVGEGDTLWSVATEADSQDEVQRVIEQIAEMNDLDSTELQLGQTLYVPADPEQ